MKITNRFLLLTCLLFVGFNAFSNNSEKLFNAQFHQGNPLPWYAEFQNPKLNSETFWTWFKKEYPTYSGFQFVVETDKTDDLGFQHIRYFQTLNGYPVNHTALIIHIKNGLVESFNTDIFLFTPQISTTHLTPESTLQTAIKNYKSEPAMSWSVAVENESPEIIWAKKTDGYSQDPFFLCHAYRIKVIEGEMHDKIYINESTGEIVRTENLIVHTDTLNKAKTLYRGLRNITADYVSKDSFRLREKNKRLIQTFLQSNGTDFWNKTNNWKDSSYATNDIHWGTEVTMDMLKKRFNVNSFDNKGTLLYSLSQPGNSGNAFWTLGGNYVNYYTGTNGSVTPCASLDVVGHELGHGVLDGISKLVYSGESGALHESFGDLQGYIVERTGDSTQYNWIVGDQVWVGGIRDMARPKNFSNPDTYNGKYWGGGFHSDAGVQNHWFYSMVHGDTGTNDNSYSYTVKGLGFEKSVKIVYRSILNYISPNTDFGMVATFDVKSAKDLYGSCGLEAAMTKEAWKAAGVIDTSTIIDFSHGISNLKLFCGTNNQNVAFSSVGDVSRKCTWYFSKTDSIVNQNTTKNFNKSGTYTIYMKTEVCNKKFMDTTTTALSLNPIAAIKPMNIKYCQSNDSLTITNTSINTESSMTINYAWIVGPFNNYNNSGKNIRVAKDAAADYYIELKAFYSNGCKDTAAIAYSVVSNVKPSFTAKNVCPCQDMKLKNTTDITGSTYSFKWVFDDTTSKTLFQPSKNYCRSGKHSIILNSTDLNTGCTDSTIRYVDIFQRPVPKIGLSAFCYGDSGQLVDLSTHNRALAYNEWSLGFWNPQNMDTVKFLVTDSLSKTFTLTVYDDLGCSNSASVSAKPEILNVNFTTQNYCEKQATQFNASIVNRQPLINYYWIINNTKKYISQLNPSEVFTPQKITASFRANTQQCKAIQTRTFEVFETPKADYTVNDEVCSGDTFYFKNATVNTLPVNHEWNFAGAGIAKTKDAKKAWNVTLATSYTVCLKETNSHNCIDSICKQVTVNENPKCDFNIENYWINYDGRAYKFVVGQNNNLEYTWDFGDGSIGNTNGFVHQYSNDGNYTIKVTVKNNSGCFCETSKSFSVLKSGIQTIAASNVKIYPIPSNGLLNIEGAANKSYQYRLYALDGKCLLNNIFTSKTTENLSDYSKGIYLLKIFDGQVWTVVKIELQ